MDTVWPPQRPWRGRSNDRRYSPLSEAAPSRGRHVTVDGPCGPEELQRFFGRIDIYVFDQLHRGRIRPGMRVLDAGCGGGRNSVYLMRCGYDVQGVDQDPQQVERMKGLAESVGSHLPPSNFRVADLDELPFEDAGFDVVLCSAVLHFARGPDHFQDMMSEMWRCLAPGGMFFARLASSIGIEGRVHPVGDRRFTLPDGSDRFLVDEAYLEATAARLHARQLDPLKTTVVQNLRSMTTWVVGK